MESTKISKFGELSKNDCYERGISFYYFPLMRNFKIKYLKEKNNILLDIWNIFNKISNDVISKMKNLL